MGSQHWALVTYGWGSKSDRPFTLTFCLFVCFVFESCYLAESVYQFLVCTSESLGFSTGSISIRSADSFTSFFAIWIHFLSFLSNCCVSTFNTILNRNGVNGHPCFVLHLERRQSAFHCQVSYWLWVCHNSFWYVEICSLCSHFCNSFYQEWMLNLINGFSASIEMVMSFLSFLLLMWCITLIDLHVLKHPYDPEINSTWSWCMISFMCCCILFANNLLRISASISIKGTGL